MQNSHWLGGAFQAYGLVDNLGRKKKVSLFTSCEGGSDYVGVFHQYAGIGRTVPSKGRWHWICDDPIEIKEFYLAVGPHMGETKRKMIEAAWNEWCRVCAEAGKPDPGEITGPLYPEIQEKLIPRVGVTCGCGKVPVHSTADHEEVR